MFKKTFLTAICLTSFCYADNFMIGSGSSGVGSAKGEEQHRTAPAAEEQNKLPQRVVIEDINPSSELGQLVNVMLKNEQKKAMQATSVAKPKTVAKKKATKKKVVKKKPVKKTVVKKEVHKEVQMEIKSEEASKVNEHEKKDAEHNENNSSLKKISSSNVCD
jgi:hypothetical protein